ncbi:hypothetical protein SEA_ZOOMAN_283 [Microbacterium phage Zooman]|nr:hypothetical protein SEA_ZOOMAN_283 [Microbacterium phage Zooman]
MPRYFIKPEPDVDLYVWWSTIVDAPIMWGTRAEFMEQYESDREMMFDFGRDFEERLDRADATGSSSHFYTAREELIFGGVGYLPWKNIPALLKLYEEDMEMLVDDPRITPLLEKFEWEEDDA